MIAALVAAIALTVSPARVELVEGGTQVVRVTNAGTAPAVLDVTRAGFALSLGGQPRVAKSKAAWLSFAPRRLVVEAGHSAELKVTSHPQRLAPGDHPGLLLLTQRPLVRGGLAVRTRIGVVVSLRVPGRVVHRLVVSAVQLATHRIRVSLANRGNVTELVARSEVTVTLWRGRKRLAVLRPATRELLPGTKGFVELRYPGRLRGLVTARLSILAAGGRQPLRRSFASRL